MKIENNNKKLYFNTDNNLSQLKKALNVIHKYNTNNKRILFVGNLDKSLKTSLNNTKHLYIPESVWVNGILTNQSACFKYLIKHQRSIGKKKMHSIVPLKKKIDLIIVIGITSISNIFNESSNTQIPTISCDSLVIKKNATYEISNSIKFRDKKKYINFICAMILATIAKSKMSIEKNKPKFHLIKKLF